MKRFRTNLTSKSLATQCQSQVAIAHQQALFGHDVLCIRFVFLCPRDSGLMDRTSRQTCLDAEKAH